MPALLIFLGAVLFVSAYQHNTPALGAQLVTDLAGFSKWAAAIVAIGILQYVPGMDKPAKALMGLVALVVILKNGSGFYSQLQAAFGSFASASSAKAAEPSQVSQASTATVTAIKEVSQLSSGVTPIKVVTGGTTGGLTGAIAGAVGGV